MPRLLDQVRDKIRVLHYSIRTEETYLAWIRRFIRFHNLRRVAGAKRVFERAPGIASGSEAAISGHCLSGG